VRRLLLHERRFHYSRCDESGTSFPRNSTNVRQDFNSFKNTKCPDSSISSLSTNKTIHHASSGFCAFHLTTFGDNVEIRTCDAAFHMSFSFDPVDPVLSYILGEGDGLFFWVRKIWSSLKRPQDLDPNSRFSPAVPPLGLTRRFKWSHGTVLTRQRDGSRLRPSRRTQLPTTTRLSPSLISSPCRPSRLPIRARKPHLIPPSGKPETLVLSARDQSAHAQPSRRRFRRPLQFSMSPPSMLQSHAFLQSRLTSTTAAWLPLKASSTSIPNSLQQKLSQTLPRHQLADTRLT